MRQKLIAASAILALTLSSTTPVFAGGYHRKHHGIKINKNLNIKIKQNFKVSQKGSNNQSIINSIISLGGSGNINVKINQNQNNGGYHLPW